MAFKGADKHRARLRRLAGPGVRASVKGVVYTAADICAKEAAVSITTGSAGGKVKGSKHEHIRSLPGEAPNNEDGDLAASIHVEPVDDLQANVVADAPHAVPLEFGTSKMQPRPFLHPAARKTRPEMLKLLGTVARNLTRR